MQLPFGMRASTLDERKRFYSRFDLRKARKWIGRDVVYAVIIGRHTGLAPPRFAADKNVPLIIDDYRSLRDVMGYVMQYLPEGVYYDRNHYHDFSLCHTRNLRDSWHWKNFAGQELAFDVDPENVVCPIHGTLKERMRRGMGLSFCAEAFSIARAKAAELCDLLSENYSDVRPVFSGRGFHMHVFDKDTVPLTQSERKSIARRYSAFAIDEWVTEGSSRLIRLPYSLNGTASRIATPLKKSEIAGFDPARKALPRFV